MQDNSTNDIIETLTRYIDGELSAEENLATEQQLKNNASLQEHYQLLLAAKRAIRMQGLKQRVQLIHKEYLEEVQPETITAKHTGKKNSIFRTLMSVAAVLIIVVAGYTVFQYTSTTNDSVYNSNFINYTAPVARGNESANNLNELYNSGKYNEAIQYFDTISNKHQQDYFIVAQSYLNLNNSQAAIDNFKQLENLNNSSAEKYFVQETDYYLMLAYIKNGDISEAEKLLDKIIFDNQHLFYGKAKNISRTKLKILELKDK